MTYDKFITEIKGDFFMEQCNFCYCTCIY